MKEIGILQYFTGGSCRQTYCCSSALGGPNLTFWSRVVKPFCATEVKTYRTSIVQCLYSALLPWRAFPPSFLPSGRHCTYLWHSGTECRQVGCFTFRLCFWICFWICVGRVPTRAKFPSGGLPVGLNVDVGSHDLGAVAGSR